MTFEAKNFEKNFFKHIGQFHLRLQAKTVWQKHGAGTQHKKKKEGKFFQSFFIQH